MSKNLKRCLSGDVDSIEMYILPESGPGEGLEGSYQGKSYNSTFDSTTGGNNSGVFGNTEDYNKTKVSDMYTEISDDMEGGFDFSRKKSSQGKDDDLEDPAYCSYCGFHFMRFTPTSFRVLILLALSAAAFVQGMVVNGFVNVVISNIERRYDLTSTETGTIASCYDIASVLCLIPVSYFGGLGCKPRYLGIGILVMGLGSIVFALPQFTTGLYSFTGDDVTYCDIGANVTACTSKDSLSNYKYVFFLGQLLHGAGASPLYTLGVTYLDENLPVRSSSMYIGIYYAFAIVGPAIGYLAGGAFLNIYVDIDTVDQDSINLTPNSPRWVGAWWIGFLLSGVLAFLVAFPMCGFPTKLPGSENYKKEREKEVYHRKAESVQTESTDSQAACNIKHIWKSVKTLITNPTFMFLNLAAACEGNLLAGFATFAPKFIEAQFSLLASDAAQYVGYAAIPAGGGGTFLGGYLVKRFNLGVRGIIRFCLAISIPCFLCVLIFLVNCENVLFAGVNIDYGELASNGSRKFLGKFTTSGCNADCGCTLENYNPVCGIDGIMYYSPCYAGCSNSIPGTDPVQYGNCSCVNHHASTMPPYMAVTGKCESACSMLPLFMAIFFLIMFFTFVISMPALSATLRCVPQHESSFALGIQWIIARCLGSIPGPILFGKMIDLTCLLWQRKCDDNEGSCFFYNNKNMSTNLMGIALAGKFLSILFFSLSLFFYKAPPSEKKKEQEDQSKNLDLKVNSKMNGNAGIGNTQSSNTSTTSINNGTKHADVNKNDTKTEGRSTTKL